MLPEPDPLPSGLGAHCARHEQIRAVVICTRCGSYACATCRRRGPDGLEYCHACVPTRQALAERGTRFSANLVDSIIVWVPFFVAIFLQVVLFDDEGKGGAFLGLGLLGSLGVAAYQLVQFQQTGQSIGKRMTGIRVVRTDGSPVSLGRLIFLRNVVPLFVASFCGLFSLVDALLIFGEERRCLHDVIADTIVVKAED